MNTTRSALTIGLKLAICLIAILAIGYAQTWVESWGGGYGGSLREPLITQIEERYSDVFGWVGDQGNAMILGLGGESNPYPNYPWDAEQGEAMVLALALLIGLYLWHTLWAAPRRRERMLAAELRPMHRLVSSPIRQTRKAAGGNKHRRDSSRTPTWP